MADMRDFTPSNDTRAQSAFVDSGEIEVKESYTLDDSGGLGEFHRRTEIGEEISSRNKVLGGVALALMLGAGGAVAYSMYAPQPEVVADASLPRTEAPQPSEVTPMAPPPPAADSSAGESMATAPNDTAMSTPQTTTPPAAAPVPRTTTQRLANAPRVTTPPAAPDMTPAPAPVTAAPSPATIAPPAVTPPQSQAAAIPEPVSPTPPASAVAGNPPLNEQSAAPAETAPAEAAPATPAPAEPTPAPQAEPTPPAAPLDQSQ